MLQGASLTTITEEITSSLNVEVTIMPASDNPITTIVTTSDLGEMEFQDYFVRHQHNLEVTEVRFEGVDRALPGPKIIDTILSASAVIVAPSNPIVSIGPILAIPGITEALKIKKESAVAISGIIDGKALKGPADRLLLDLGHEASPVGVARIYSEIVSNFVIDNADGEHAKRIEELGMRCLTTDTVMSDPKKSAKLCSALLSLFFPEVLT